MQGAAPAGRNARHRAKAELSLLLNLADCSSLLLASRQGAGYLSVYVDAALVETGRVAVLMMIPLAGAILVS
jgi:hypothetical protein